MAAAAKQYFRNGPPQKVFCVVRRVSGPPLPHIGHIYDDVSYWVLRRLVVRCHVATCRITSNCDVMLHCIL